MMVQGDILGVMAALLHDDAAFSLTHFSIHWSTVIGIAALAGLYHWRARVGPTAPPPSSDAPGATPAATDTPTAHAPSAAQRLAFAAGLAVLFLSLNGPLHDLSDGYLFSAHMTQHMLLAMAVTPLLIAGTPGWMLRPALRIRAVAAAARWVTHPPHAFAIFSVTLIAWHLPVLYNTAMAHHGVHIVQHLCFLVASTLLWWPLMSSMPELPRLSHPKQMLYALLMMVPMTAVSIFVTYADTVLYTAYAAAPRVTGLSPLQDQRLGGLIMWIPGSFIVVGVVTVIFFHWAGAEERRDAAERDATEQAAAHGATASGNR
ncbi:MAG TPA: cytochrome c oxidase assembly protein [Gemmatimonadaceae bacterium]|nr:cytochrome c oxidase assembly protein [Gemmatimonadaceae bacterium]